MCGFAGFLGKFALGQPCLDAMGRAVYHRGPDDSGTWCDPAAEVGLAFRRLSILDLSSAGHQPMQSARGRFVLVFNGEIYNHLELRKCLKEQQRVPRWRGHSDTETLLAGFEAWGIEATVTQAAGMFAFAVWDRASHELTLGRDRLGEKPLYYGWQNNAFLFASELKALRAHPAFDGEIDRHALTLLMRHNYIPAPYCIYRGMKKLLPGSLLTVALGVRESSPRRYWDALAVVAHGKANPFTGTPAEAVEALTDELRQSIGRQMIADVPLGAFLSGGIDSSTVVALMQELSDRPVRTFTIGFAEDGFDEAVYARKVAAQIGTDHEELYVSAAQARDVIPMLPTIYCEPFSDASQIPTFLVSRLARQRVTVALSGDGGDELFAGYDRYVLSQRFWRTMSRVPMRARAALGGLILKIPADQWTQCLSPLEHFIRGGVTRIGEKVVKGAQALSARDATELYRLLVSHWTRPETLVLDAREPATVLTANERLDTDSFVHDMMALDLISYLPDDILVKVDRAAMANSLETRVPFLDHTIVEFAWRLPLEYKLRNGVSKWPLREILHRRVPRDLVERPKMGFGIPIDSWLCGPLRSWAEDLLSETRLRAEGFFEPAAIRRKWRDHVSGARQWHYHLWDVLMFQAWLAEQKRPAGFVEVPV